VPLENGTRVTMTLEDGLMFDAEVRRVMLLPGGTYALGVQAFASNATQIDIARVIARGLFQTEAGPSSLVEQKAA
jgi:hypothetical protein